MFINLKVSKLTEQ